MHGKPDGSKARKETAREVLNEQSIFLNQSEISDGIVCNTEKEASQDLRSSQVG